MQIRQISPRNSKLFLFSQLCDSLIFTIPIWIVYYQSKITISQISLLVMLQYAVQLVMELPNGAFADIFSRKLTAGLGYLFGAISFLLFPFATHFWQFIVLATLVGVKESFRSGSEEALLYDSLKQDGREKDYNRIYAQANIVYQVGLIVGTFSGGFLYSIYYGLPYFFYGIILLVGAISNFYYFEPKVDSETFTLKNYLLQIKHGTQQAFKSKITTSVSLFYIFVGSIAWTSTLYFNDFLLIDLGFGNQARGVISAGIRLLNAFVLAKLLTNKKIFTMQRTILFFPIIMMTAYLPALLLEGFWGVPFIQMAMIATTARWGLLSPLTNSFFESKYRATAISVLSMFIGIIYVVITGVSGPIIEAMGIKFMYMLLGILTAISVVPTAAWLLHHHKQLETY